MDTSELKSEEHDLGQMIYQQQDQWGRCSALRSLLHLARHSHQVLGQGIRL
jgi:hypothetical protein